MGYTDYSDEDDQNLNDWIGSQSEGANELRPYANDPRPAQPRIPAYKNPELQPEGDDPWNAVVNYGIPAIAALLDAKTNHGRGVGTILQSAALQANQRSVGKRELAAEKLKAVNDDDQRAMRQAMLDYQWASLGNRQDQGWQRIANQTEGLGLRKAEQDFSLNPENAQAQRGVAKTKELTGVDLEGLNARQQGQQMPTVGRIQGAALAPETAGNVRQAQINTDLANQGATNAMAAGKTAAEADARVRATTGAERDVNADTPIANAEVVNPGVWGALNDAQRTKALATAQAYRVFDGSLATMKALSAKNGVQNLPSGDKAAYDAAHGAALGQLADLYHTGVINKEEYYRMSSRLPESGGIKSNAASAVGWATGTPNILGDMISGSGGETLKELSAMMSQYGIKPAASGGGAQQQPPPAARAKGGPDMSVPTADTTLKVTGTGAKGVPKFSPEPGAQLAQPGGPKRMRHVVSVTGEVEDLPLDDSEAEYLMTTKKVRSID